jgi:L-fucose dehydrogenase
MNLNLTDKIIIVTGGAKGIGLGTDNQIAVKEIEAEGGKALSVVAELTNPEACKSAVDQVVSLCGRIDGLINNAGVNDGVGLESGDYEKFVASIHKNLVHYYLMAQHVLPELKKTKGAIVNIGSKVADTGQGNTSAYAASNGGEKCLNPRMGR